MLPSSSRLRGSGDFRDTVSKGVRVGREHLVLYLRARTGPPSRFGLIVSKRVGNAVTRNRVKRRLRHLGRELLGTLDVDVDVVVRALPGARDADLGGELAGAVRSGERKLAVR